MHLADEKTETVRITNRRKDNSVKFRVGNYEVETISILRYLGVMIDIKLNFNGVPGLCARKGSKGWCISSYDNALYWSTKIYSTAPYHRGGEMHPVICGSCLGTSTGQHGETEKSGEMIPWDLIANGQYCLHQRKKANPVNVTADFRKATRKQLHKK